jgi:two-component system, OmpR family, response regulator
MAKNILVVDDDDEVREVLIAMLESSGFTASSAACGVAMRDILVDDGTPVDAIVLDCMMPGEQGTELALHAQRLQIPVVISGSPDARNLAHENGLQLLEKPFSIADLVAALGMAIASENRVVA